MARKIVAFAGVQGSGKDYRCQELVRTKGYKQLAFATALRKIAFVTIGMSYEEGMKQYEELKKTVLFNGLTFRNILENLGTEGIRSYDNDFWVRCLIHDIDKLPENVNVCVSDLRFYNEYIGLVEYCAKKGYEFEFIFCDYHSERYEANNSHASAQLANYLVNIGYEDGEHITSTDMFTFKNFTKQPVLI